MRKVRRTQSKAVERSPLTVGVVPVLSLAVIAATLYSILRILLDAIATSRRDQAKLQAEVLVLRRQVQVLERQIKRVKWTPADRMVLAALRDRLPRSAWAALRVQPETVLGWHRDLVRRRWAGYRDRPSRARPPLSQECRELVVRMARENSRWGYFRIRGELLKLGYTVSATTIRSILRRAHVPPAGRRSELTWKQFLAAHAETLVATDFFSVDTVFLKRLYVLMFVHVGTRRVLAASCTAEPNSAWVTQQARNLSWQLEEEGIRLSLVIYRLALTGLEDLLRYAAQVAEPEAERLASRTRIGPDWV